MTGHPIRRAAIHTFTRLDSNEGGANVIARFHPYDAWPIFFHGVDEQDAIGKAEEFRQEVIAKNEAEVLRRQRQRQKAKERAQAKKALT